MLDNKDRKTLEFTSQTIKGSYIKKCYDICVGLGDKTNILDILDRTASFLWTDPEDGVEYLAFPTEKKDIAIVGFGLVGLKKVKRMSEYSPIGLFDYKEVVVVNIPRNERVPYNLSELLLRKGFRLRYDEVLLR